MIETNHDEDCDKRKIFTDGIFWECLCGARLLNTFAGAHFKKDKA